MEEAGHKLKKIRERLNLRYRDVEDLSGLLAAWHRNDEYSIALSRLADIENKGTIPSLFRLYALCAIYRLDMNEVLEWYGIRPSGLPAESARLELERTHLLGFTAETGGDVVMPIALDPGIDVKKTTFLSRMIRRWGKLPLMLLNGLDIRQHRYAYLGTQDWSMYPVLYPGSLLLIDETRRKIQTEGWSSDYDRPIYFLEHRQGFACGYCSLAGEKLVLHPHPCSTTPPLVFASASEVDMIGQVVGVAMRLGPARRRRTQS